MNTHVVKQDLNRFHTRSESADCVAKKYETVKHSTGLMDKNDNLKTN